MILFIVVPPLFFFFFFWSRGSVGPCQTEPFVHVQGSVKQIRADRYGNDSRKRGLNWAGVGCVCVCVAEGGSLSHRPPEGRHHCWDPRTKDLSGVCPFFWFWWILLLLPYSLSCSSNFSSSLTSQCFIHFY